MNLNKISSNSFLYLSCIYNLASFMKKVKSQSDIAEYDKELCDFLLENKFDENNILDICRSGLSVIITFPNNLDQMVAKFQKHQSGCIFSLPNGLKRIGVYWSPMSSNEIRRTVALKAFL